MACGHKGVGRLTETTQILEEILKFRPAKAKRALVTLGGVRESLDGVRFVTNFSTGVTGLEICESLKKDFNVTAVGAEEAFYKRDLFGVNKLRFLSSQNLSELLERELSQKHYDLIVHAAAVSDFVPKDRIAKKISSDQNFNIDWKKNPKILDRLREWSQNKEVKIVSFKLTHNQTWEEKSQKIQNQLKDKKSDFVVHNELSFVDEKKHDYKIWKAEKSQPFAKGETKKQLAEDILNIGLQI